VLERRKKISKKQIKEDKLVTTYYQAVSFYQKYQSKILIAVGAVALVVVAIILFSNKRANDNNTAAALLAKVIPLYDANSFKEAIEGQKAQNITGLKAIVDKYGSTEQGETAKILLANSYAMMGNLEAAFEMFDDYSGSSSLYKAAALSGKADYYQTKKDYEKAADLYRDASKLDKLNPANPEYVLNSGIAYLKAGSKDDAKAMFATLKKEYKTSQQLMEVDRYLVQLEN
jgi:tetratricopeptide (TPR) repeat protein